MHNTYIYIILYNIINYYIYRYIEYLWLYPTSFAGWRLETSPASPGRWSPGPCPVTGALPPWSADSAANPPPRLADITSNL